MIVSLRIRLIKRGTSLVLPNHSSSDQRLKSSYKPNSSTCDGYDSDDVWKLRYQFRRFSVWLMYCTRRCSTRKMRHPFVRTALSHTNGSFIVTLTVLNIFPIPPATSIRNWSAIGENSNPLSGTQPKWSVGIYPGLNSMHNMRNI